MWWVTFRRVVVKDRGGLGRQGFGEDRLLVAVREQRRAEGRIGLQLTLLQHRPHMRDHSSAFGSGEGAGDGVAAAYRVSRMPSPE